MDGYRAAQVGFLPQRALVSKDAAREDLKGKLLRWDGPFEGSPGHTNAWGPVRTRGEIIDRAFDYIDNDPLGLRFRIRSVKHPEMPTFVVQRAFDVLGGDVIKVGLTQLGVRYVFADVNPRGPAGGPGEGFDCSGFVLWCYDQVGVTLEHQAEQMRTDPQMQLFQDQHKAIPGDAVFMWFPNSRNIPSNHASHVGLWVASGRMLDTRNPVNEPVAIRPIEAGSVIAFGRVVRVNGKLAA